MYTIILSVSEILVINITFYYNTGLYIMLVHKYAFQRPEVYKKDNNLLRSNENGSCFNMP